MVGVLSMVGLVCLAEGWIRIGLRLLSVVCVRNFGIERVE